MIVEDNPSDLKYLSDILIEAGHRVRPASDGELGLRSVRAKRPDLILLDFKLPGMNGVEVCRHLKADPETRDIPVIFISALGKTDLKVNALQAGGIDYITKPIEPSEVLARISTHLNMHRLQKRLAIQSEELIAEIEERKLLEEELVNYRDHLEDQVKKRTTELEKEINERRLAEKTLRKLSSAVEQSPASVVITSLSGLIEYVNPKFEKLTGYSLKEAVGENPRILKSGEHSAEFYQELWDTITNGREWQGTFHNKKKNGELYWESATIAPIIDHNGEIINYLAVKKDITEQRQAEEQIKASLNEKETLLQEIHHRVKNNMAIIVSLLKLQMHRIDDERVKGALKESQSRVYSMSAVHETLCSSENLSEIGVEPFIGRIAKHAFQSYRIDANQVSLKTEFEPIKLNLEKATPLGLVINELVTNSLKYAFPDSREGEITIRIKKLAMDDLEITFEDNGIGFPEGLDWNKSAGFGLQLVKNIVEVQLDGSLRFKSDKATTFVIRFKA